MVGIVTSSYSGVGRTASITYSDNVDRTRSPYVNREAGNECDVKAAQVDPVELSRRRHERIYLS